MLYTRLSDWINPVHLDTAQCQAYAAEMTNSAARMLVLDNFLIPARLAELQAVLREAGALQPVFALSGQGAQRCNEREWRQAPESQRFYHHLEVDGPRPGYELSRAYLAHISLSDVLATRPFLDYFATLSGESLKAVGRVNGKVLGNTQCLRPHSDAEPGRRLCAVLYLNDDWQPDYGGEFLLFDSERQPVGSLEPRCNRILLFIPNSGYLHAVAPFTPQAGNWRRWNYSFWWVG